MAAALQAQISMSLQVAPAGVVQKAQLWNMVLVNTSSTSVAVYINLSLLSISDNRPLMTATARSIVLNKGAKQIAAADIAPIQYNYLSSVFNIDRNPDGFLPIGNYKACYTVYKIGNEGNVPLAEDCIPVEVQPLSPPLLNTPADNDSIETPYPQFTWLPPVPLNLFSDLNYNLLLVEVLPGQTKGDAIQKNVPVYNAYAQTPFNNYSASGKSLDTGKTYAWKVVARNADEPVAQTDIWTFKVGSIPATTKIPFDGSYILLQNDLKAVYNIIGDSIHVKYFSYEKTHAAPIVFADQGGQLIYQQTQQIKPGDNYFDLKLSRRLDMGEVYLISITGLDNKKHAVRFSISKNQ